VGSLTIGLADFVAVIIYGIRKVPKPRPKLHLLIIAKEYLDR